MSEALIQNPFWWEAAPPQEALHQTVESECDVVIIGAGYTGLSAALTLAAAGKHVQVFDKDHIGAGASSRNGGITSGNLRVSLSQAMKRFGSEKACQMFLEANEARQHLRDLITQYNIDCDYALTGSFNAALTETDFDQMKHEAELVNRKTGIETQIITRDMLPDYTGSMNYVGGTSTSSIGTIHPAKLANGLYQAARKAGVIFHSETAVLMTDKHSGLFQIKTERGSCMAANIIVATNGYTDTSDKWLSRRLVPVKSRIVVTEELSQNLVNDLIPQARAIGERKKLYRYFRPTPDGKRILMGGREPPWSNNRDRVVEHGRQALIKIFPQLEDVGITHSWSGNVAFSRRHIPQLFTHNGIHYAVGYCGSGTVWAPWLGKKAALQILDDPDAKSCFRSEPPPSIPFYNGKPWFIQAVIASYGIQDWLNSKR